jgi:hypothetical protein
MNRKALAKFLTADEEKFTIVTHEAATMEGHKQLIPQEIEECGWSEEGEGLEGELVFSLDVGGAGLVPANHDSFLIRYEGEIILADKFHETKGGTRRFYELVIEAASRRGEWKQGKGPHLHG